MVQHRPLTMVRMSLTISSVDMLKVRDLNSADSSRKSARDLIECKSFAQGRTFDMGMTKHCQRAFECHPIDSNPESS